MGCTIYALVDPRTSRVRYVGFTRGKLELRIQQHLTGCGQPLISAWVAELAQFAGPIVIVLETVEGQSRAARGTARSAEQGWIKAFRDAGADLLNRRGGQPLPLETRLKMSASAKATWAAKRAARLAHPSAT
jgi:hypothetical protein